MSKAKIVNKIFGIYKRNHPDARLLKYQKQYVLKRDNIATKSTTVFNNSYTLLCYLERSV